MNKAYLVSLVGYLAFNSAFFVLLSVVMGNPMTLVNFLFTTTIAVVLHKFFIWKG